MEVPSECLLFLFNLNCFRINSIQGKDIRIGSPINSYMINTLSFLSFFFIVKVYNEESRDHG